MRHPLNGFLVFVIVCVTCYMCKLRVGLSDNPWTGTCSSYTTIKSRGQIFEAGAMEGGGILLLHHVVTILDPGNRGVKAAASKYISNLAGRDAHARTTQESHLARTTRDPGKVRSATSPANMVLQEYRPLGNNLVQLQYLVSNVFGLSSCSWS